MKNSSRPSEKSKFVARDPEAYNHETALNNQKRLISVESNVIGLSSNVDSLKDKIDTLTEIISLHFTHDGSSSSCAASTTSSYANALDHDWKHTPLSTVWTANLQSMDYFVGIVATYAKSLLDIRFVNLIFVFCVAYLSTQHFQGET